MQKDSPYYGIFNHYIHSKRQDGTLKKIMNSYKPPPQKCPDYSGKPSSLYSCFTAFVVIISGIVTSIVIFSLEFIGNYFNYDFMNIQGNQGLRESNLLNKIWKKNTNTQIKEDNSLDSSSQNIT